MNINKKTFLARQEYLLAKHLYKSTKLFFKNKVLNDGEKLFYEVKLRKYYNQLKEAEKVLQELSIIA